MKHLGWICLCFSTACGAGTHPGVPGDGGITGDMATTQIGNDAGLPPLSTTSAVTIVVEPEDKGQAFIDAVKNATKSIHMTMYLLTDTTILKSLEAQHKAGLDVMVLLNESFPDNESSTQAYDELKGAGVSVKYAPSTYQYTHEKTVILDGQTALIMTMNASSSAFTGNREYLALDTDAADVAEAEALFQADWSNTATHTMGKLITAPDNAEARLDQFIDSAEKTLDLEGEVFSSSILLNAIGRAQKRGVTCRLVLSDETPTTAQTNAIMGLKQVNIPVVTVSNPDIHAKAIVIDGALAYVGSENFTSNSLENNRELGLLVSAQSEVDKVATTIAADFAAGTPQ